MKERRNRMMLKQLITKFKSHRFLPEVLLHNEFANKFNSDDRGLNI